MPSFSTSGPDRYDLDRLEELRFKVSISKEEWDRLSSEDREKITRMLRSEPTFNNGDKYHISYTIDAQYYGRVAERLELIESLIDKGLVVNAEFDELIQGSSLIYNVIAKIERIANKLGLR